MSGSADGATLWYRVSGPVTTIDAPLDTAEASRVEAPRLEISTAREATVGAILVLEGDRVDVEGQAVEAGQLAYLGQGRRSLSLRTGRQARLLLLGGEPFAEPIVMWWNFVARTRAEVELASREWNAREPRFGVVSSPLARIPAPAVPQGLRG